MGWSEADEHWDREGEGRDGTGWDPGDKVREEAHVLGGKGTVLHAQGPTAERVSDGGEKGPDCQVLPPAPRLWARRGGCPR